MHCKHVLIFLFICSHIAWLSTSLGLVIVIPFKFAFPLKSLIAFGVLKAAKKTLFRGFYKIVNPLGLRRTDPANYREMESLMAISSQDQHLQNQLFQHLAQEDSKGCLKRLVCEMHATNDVNAQGVAEKFIVDLFGKMSPQHKSLPSFSFHQAATIGHKGKDPELCRKYYSSCPYSSQQLMNTFTKSIPAQSHPP